MKQFFKILALAALALPFTGCDVEYSDINILPDPVFEQNGLYTVNTISIYDDYETVINVSRTAGLSKELELDIVVDETLLAEYNELYNTDYKLLEAQFYDIPKNAQLASTVKSVDISVRIHPKALIAAKGMAAANNMLLPIRISNASTPVEDGGSMMQALLRLNIVEPIVQVEMPEQMPQLEFIPTIPLPQEITLNATANFNTLEVAKIGYRVNASKVDAYNEEHGTWSFGLMHELGHVFNLGNSSWNWNDEMFANFRMQYGLEQNQGKVWMDERVYTGRESLDMYKKDYDKTVYTQVNDNGIHYMLGRLAGPGGIGWEPFKSAFRELTTTGGAPSGKYDKFEYLLSLLSKHATRLTGRDVDVRAQYFTEAELASIRKQLQ